MQKGKVKVVVILSIGIVLGVISSISDHLNFSNAFFIVGGLINSASFWCLSAFLIGSRFKSRKFAILIPILFLGLSVLSYYAAEFSKNNISLLTLLPMIISWLVMALLLGALCGLAGRTAVQVRDIKKRMVAVTIPMTIILTESLISILQILPYLKNGTIYFIPFVVLLIFCVTAFFLPFIIFRHKKVAIYTSVLGLLVSVLCSFLLMLLGNR